VRPRRRREGRTRQRGHQVPGAAAPGITTQKQALHASERDTPRTRHARQDSHRRISALDSRRLTCVEESSVNLAMTRLDGRAPAGERVVGSVPQNYGPNVTLLGALSVRGLPAVMTIDGPTDADVFRPSVKQGLGPSLAPGDIVVMDNLQAHKAVGVQQAIARRGARRLYWPPYSPDLSPIEPCWSKVKTALRQVKARTRAGLDAAIAEVMLTVSPMDAWNWFKHGGYPVH
jgi:transposase